MNNTSAFPNSNTNFQKNNMHRLSNYNNAIKSKKSLDDFMIKKCTEIELVEQIFCRKNGLGNIFKSTHNGIDVGCRLIKFNRLSRYDLEGISKDMEEIT